MRAFAVSALKVPSPSIVDNDIEVMPPRLPVKSWRANHILTMGWDSAEGSPTGRMP
jgi:hypothetical protein